MSLESLQAEGYEVFNEDGTPRYPACVNCERYEAALRDGICFECKRDGEK